MGTPQMIGNLSNDELWVIATAGACAIACAIPGVFLMLKRASLLGDAISHSILPGLALAFIASGSRSPVIMMFGALVAGIATAVCSTSLRCLKIIKEDAALGIVFTSFFALGVLLISWAARSVDLDPGCVLYGLVEFAPFDTVRILSFEVPRTFAILSVIALFNATLVTLFFKELMISTFDRQLASTLGFRPRVIDYALMVMVTITAVASFEAVGSILVVSMLITPAATAYLLSSRLCHIMLLSVLVSICSAVGGYAGALSLNTSVAGMMSVIAALCFIAALLLSPTNGVLRARIDSLSLRYRIYRDDILGMLYRWHEVVGRDQRNPLSSADIESALGSFPLVKLALWSLRREGAIITSEKGTLRLSEHGLVDAAALIRSHRLWEAYLAKHLGLPKDHLHEPSERTEHFIGRALARELQDDLSTSKDPHGRSIP
jgi:manganese/zinc/iron transport system permease protein